METASSATSTSGSRVSARAMKTRWRMPPDNWCGYCGARPGSRPTRSSNSSSRSSTHDAGRPVCAARIRNGVRSVSSIMVAGLSAEYGS